MPSAANSPQELFWDASLKAVNVRTNFANAITAAFFVALTVGTHLLVRLSAVHAALIGVIFLLAGVGWYLLLRSRPGDPVPATPMVGHGERPVHR